MLYSIIGGYVTTLHANEIIGNHVRFPGRQNVSLVSTNMYRARYAIVTILWWMIVVSGDGDVVRNEDICGPQNGRRLYLELGEKGILYAKNISFTKNDPQEQQGVGGYASNSSHDQCSFELVTCPSCVIIVTFRSLSLSHHCGVGGVTVDSPCRCDYVWISEPPYEDVSGTPFCGLYAPITYRSSTRTLSIALLYSQSHADAFTLEYTAERNRLHLRGAELMTGTAKGLNSTGGGILTSPFFPARYPRDLGLEYIVTCPTEAPACRIRLLFSDFQLATVSIMEFYDWNGQRLDVSSGARFRPPVIMSSGPSLLIRFYANGGTGLGYKAFYSFVIGHLYDKSVQPLTDCGGYVENLGGAITMMDMVGEGVKTYDCVWLIRPPKNFLHAKTHMYLKVVTFDDMAGNTELVIKQGPTSALLPLEVLRHPARQLQAPRHREHVAPVTSGFHVSLRGTFGSASHLAIAYAAFSYMDCFSGSDFLCQNHRCIPSQLNCDGFDHCGDDSDEPTTCFRDWEMEPQDRKWHTNKANYYFPKIDRYPDLKTATLVFVASSLGLIVLISALIILLYRMGARARQQRELQSRLQTISELLDGARIDDMTVQDDPPVYEAPPGYDEVVKLSLELDGPGRKKRRNYTREPRSRSSPGQCCSLDHGQSAMGLVGEIASTSRGSQTTPIPSTTANLPKTPPPPYATPPGMIPRTFTSISMSTSHDSMTLGDGRRLDVPVDGSPCAIDAEGAEGIESGREWCHRDFPLPTPGNESIDAELLGAYVRDPVGPSSNCSDSQPRSSRDASTDTEPDCGEQIAGAAEPPATREEQEQEQEQEVTDPVEAAETPETVERFAEQGAEAGVELKTGVAKADDNGECYCQGACGCANVRLSTNVEGNASGPPFSDDTVFKTVLDRRQIFERECVRTLGKTEEKNREDQEEFSRSRNAIIRLLASRAGRWQTGSGGSTTASTATSTPSGTLRRSTRKFSVCSRESYVSKISSIGSCSSYEKLHNEPEIVSAGCSQIYANLAPPNTPAQHRRMRRYSSCDLESFYEGIKVLDGFLARSGLVVSHGRKQSIAVTVFGTPDHGTLRNREMRDTDQWIRQRTRVWRSNEDTLHN